MRWQPQIIRRSGTALVETAITITVLLSLLLGSLDLGVAVFRQHALSQAARQGVRKAIVHGSLAPTSWNGGPWGPGTYGPVAATDTDPKAQAIAPFLTGMDPSTVTVTYTWPDGKNTAEKRVQVSLSTTWTPILGFVFGSSPVTITASSEMQIAH